MRDQLIQSVQEIASGKAATAVAVGTATSPIWAGGLDSPLFAGGLVVLGAVVSLTIICVNVQTFFYRSARHIEEKKQNRLRLRLMEHEAETKQLKL